MIAKIYKEFFSSIIAGNLEKVVEIWNLVQNIKYIDMDIHIFNDYAFKLCCYYDHIEIAKWLWDISLSINSSINLLSNNNSIYIDSGDKNMEDLFLEILLDNNSHILISNNEIFLYSCSYGNIEIAKWLWQIHIDLNSPIDIHANKDKIFYWTCHYEQVEVAKWLCELCDEYHVVIEDNKIIDYKIINIYDKILKYAQNDDLEQLNKIFKNKIIQPDIKKMCVICKQEEEKYIVNLKCNINSKEYDHYYCLNCFCNWYRNNEKKCLCCFCDFDLKNISINL
jgi:hypothetical protein